MTDEEPDVAEIIDRASLRPPVPGLDSVPPASHILVVDDDESARELVQLFLEQDGLDVTLANSVQEAFVALHEPVDLILLDIDMPGRIGLDMLTEMRDMRSTVPVIVVSGAGGPEEAVRALKLGALDYVEKPVRRERLHATVQNALRFASLQRAHRELLSHDASLVGDSAAMRQLKTLLGKVAPTEGRVLIVGENGVGKEIVAGVIHAASRRAAGPFVKLNCGAVPTDLVESELFGHEKGAFTGAVISRKGRFELADHGTLLLDEIGDMPMAMQVKLLRVLQEGRFERVGGSRTLHVDVRVVAATNQPLVEMVNDGRFREDLYYRLNVVTVSVPPLRERLEDIPALVRRFSRPEGSADGLVLDASALDALKRYHYPGNVRELQNILERLAILYGAVTVRAADVEAVLAAGGAGAGRAGKGLYQPGATLRELLRELERQILVEAIAAHAGNKSAARTALGMERSHFYKKLREHDLAGGSGTD